MGGKDGIACSPQRAAQARARGMRDGAREALRQLGERLESLSTDKHRRGAGMIHKMWQWINDRVP